MYFSVRFGVERKKSLNSSGGEAVKEFIQNAFMAIKCNGTTRLDFVLIKCILSLYVCFLMADVYRSHVIEICFDKSTVFMRTNIV